MAHNLNNRSHAQSDCQQQPDAWTPLRKRKRNWKEQSEYSIEQGEEQKVLQAPHMCYLKMMYEEDRNKRRHQYAGNTEMNKFLPGKPRRALLVITPGNKITGNQKEQSHEERRIRGQEMPYSWHQHRII